MSFIDQIKKDLRANENVIYYLSGKFLDDFKNPGLKSDDYKYLLKEISNFEYNYNVDLTGVENPAKQLELIKYVGISRFIDLIVGKNWKKLKELKIKPSVLNQTNYIDYILKSNNKSSKLIIAEILFENNLVIGDEKLLAKLKEIPEVAKFIKEFEKHFDKITKIDIKDEDYSLFKSQYISIIIKSNRLSGNEIFDLKCVEESLANINDFNNQDPKDAPLALHDFGLHNLNLVLDEIVNKLVEVNRGRVVKKHSEGDIVFYHSKDFISKYVDDLIKEVALKTTHKKPTMEQLNAVIYDPNNKEIIVKTDEIPKEEITEYNSEDELSQSHHSGVSSEGSNPGSNHGSQSPTPTSNQSSPRYKTEGTSDQTTKQAMPKFEAQIY